MKGNNEGTGYKRPSDPSSNTFDRSSDRITGNEEYRDSGKVRDSPREDNSTSIVLDSDQRNSEKDKWRLSLRLKGKHDEENEIESVRSTLTLIAKDTSAFRSFQANTKFVIGLVATICCAGF